MSWSITPYTYLMLIDFIEEQVCDVCFGHKGKLHSKFSGGYLGRRGFAHLSRDFTRRVLDFEGVNGIWQLTSPEQVGRFVAARDALSKP